MDKSALIFGSTSEIAQWIIEGLLENNINPVQFSRSTGDSRVDFGNYNAVLKLLKDSFLKYPNTHSLYFCIGKYSQSDIAESDPIEWLDDISVNLGYAYICYRALSEVSRTFPGDVKIIFLGSTSSISKPREFSSYAISKSSLEMLTTFINNEPPRNIRACCIRLGTCMTSFSKSENNTRMIQKNDLIQTVNYLEKVSFHVFPDLLSLRPIKAEGR